MFGRSGFLVGLLFLLGAWMGPAAADDASWQSHNSAGLQALQEGDTIALLGRQRRYSELRSPTGRPHIEARSGGTLLS